jgi:peroxiredoxin family protein
MSKVFAALILASVAITLAWDVALVWGLVHLFQG